MTITLNGTGTVTGANTLTNTNTVTSATATALTLQSAGTTGVTIDTSQNLQFNSGYGSVATAYGCRAWVNFNGTGTVAIRTSGNVSSITDNGVGDYTVNFTTALVDANYATIGMQSTDSVSPRSMSLQGTTGAATTSNVRFQLSNFSGTGVDSTTVCVSIFR